MDRNKLIVLEDVPAENAQRLCDLLHGDDNLSAFFEDPYLDSVLADAVESDEWVTLH